MCPLLIPLPEHLLLEPLDPLQVNVSRAGQVANVGPLESHLKRNHVGGKYMTQEGILSLCLAKDRKYITDTEK